MNEIIFKAITADSKDKDFAEKIYNEAFPERERQINFEDMLQLEQNLDISNINLVYEGEQIIGFMNYFEFEEYVYLWFFAVNSELRGGGYGSRILRAFREKISGKEIIACIETPIPGTSNYDQRVKRKVFYERLGITMTAYSFGEDEEDMLTLISSCHDGREVGYIRSFFAFMQQVSNASDKTSAYTKKKFYRTEDGKNVEVFPAEWLK